MCSREDNLNSNPYNSCKKLGTVVSTVTLQSLALSSESQPDPQGWDAPGSVRVSENKLESEGGTYTALTTGFHMHETHAPGSGFRTNVFFPSRSTVKMSLPL